MVGGLLGTGGTIAGVSEALKAALPDVRVFLVDPPGSGLYNKVTRGVMFTSQEAEQKRLKNPSDTITEGVGINRVTQNFARWVLCLDSQHKDERSSRSMAAL